MRTSLGIHYSLQSKSDVFNCNFTLCVINIDHTVCLVVRSVSILLEVDSQRRFSLINAAAELNLRVTGQVLPSCFIEWWPSDKESSFCFDGLSIMSNNLRFKFVRDFQLCTISWYVIEG